MPSLYPTLKEFDPTCSGMSRIRYSEAAYQRWQRERSKLISTTKCDGTADRRMLADKYLEGMMMDFRTLGIVVCQLVSRRVFSTIELEQFRKVLVRLVSTLLSAAAHHTVPAPKKSFTYDLFASTISLDKYPLALCDLLRCCFQQSPYEVLKHCKLRKLRLTHFHLMQVGYTVEDDSSGGAGSLYSGGTSILSAEQRFMKDLNIPQQLKVGGWLE